MSCDDSALVYDLLIIGAGMFGSAAARHASANVGVKVCLVGPDEPSDDELKTREIFGAHYDEGRITYTFSRYKYIQVMAKQSMSRYRELEELSGIQFYHPVGYIYVAKKNSPYMENYLQTTHYTKHSLVDLSYNDILKRRYPILKLKSDNQSILEDSGAGHISPRNMVAAQKKVAKIQGCHIVNDVVNEVKLYNGIHKVITESERVLNSKRVLICTGAFTNLKNLSIPKLKIDIYKETFILMKIPVEEAERLSYMPSMGYMRQDEVDAYILPPIQYPNGNYYLKIGQVDFDESTDHLKTLEDIKKWYLSNGDPQRIEKLSKFLINILPGLKYEEIIGRTCATSDNPSLRPYIDRVSPTVTVAVVGNGRGATISDEVGRIAAHLSLTGTWDSELSQSLFKVILNGD